eukprot:PhM_4_TR5290/c0_g1_i1/m.87014
MSAQKLRLFYEIFNPAKLDTVDTILDEYRDREDDLFHILSEKYDTDFFDDYDGVTGFYTTFAPERLGNVPAILREHHADVEALFNTLDDKYGTSYFSSRAQLQTIFYGAQQWDSLRNVDKLLNENKHKIAEFTEETKKAFAQQQQQQQGGYVVQPPA